MNPLLSLGWHPKLSPMAILGYFLIPPCLFRNVVLGQGREHSELGDCPVPGELESVGDSSVAIFTSIETRKEGVVIIFDPGSYLVAQAQQGF